MKIINNRNRCHYRLLTFALIIVMVFSINAKGKKGIIMTVDGEEVPSEEFVYLFLKNNQQQGEPQSLDEYLELFKTYRLKVAEAKSEGIDTTKSFQNEVKLYKRELLEPYITDTAYVNHLIDIAVERENTEIESSHIMFIRTHDENKDKRNLELLDSLREEILNGADFIEIAKKYSQDKFSSDKGGYLGFTPAGTFPYAFETAEYETPEGEISDIIESHVGWHIVKSGSRRPASDFNHPIRNYDEIKAEVLRKVSSPFDSRFHEIRDKNMEYMKKRHKNIKDLEKLTKEEAYEVLMSMEEEEQYNNNVEYRNLVDEYTNGSLLYEVSVKNIWDKAGNDEEGLEALYNKNKEKYKWDSPHAKGILIQAVNDSILGIVKDNIREIPTDSIVEYVRNNFKKEATADKFNMPKGVNPVIDKFMFEEFVENPKIKNFKSFLVVDGRIVNEPEELNDIRGYVVSDYQEQLEKEWVDLLLRKHTVEINQKELERLKRSLK